VRGQLAPQLFAQLHQSQPVLRTRDHEGDDPLITRLIFPHLNHRTLDVRVPIQHRLDLFQFDPIAADLDLTIHTAAIVELPVRSPAHQVAGPIQTGSRKA
jgi:hypothetical protein